MAITLDQALGSNNVNTGGGSTFTITTSQIAAAGSRIVVCVSWFTSTSTTITGISDGSAYTQRKHVANGSDLFDVWDRVLVGSLASGSTITVTLSNTTWGGMLGAACSYLGTTAVDTTSSNTTTGTSFSSGAATNAVADALFVGGAGNETALTSVGGTNTNGTSRFDLWNSVAQQGMRMLDLIATTTGSQALTGTWGVTSTATTGGLVIYKGTASVAAAPTVFPVYLPRNITGRGVRNQRAMRLYVRTPPLLATGVTFTDAVTGALIFGGTVEEDWTWAFPQQSHPRRLPVARGLRDPAGLRRYARTPSALAYAAVLTFTDTATGAWIFGSSVVEAKRGTDAGSGAWIFAGSRVEAKRGTDARSGSLIFGGTRTEAITFVQARSGSLIFGGTRTELKRGTDAQAGAVIFGGSRTELKRYGDTRSGSVTFGGSATQLRVGTDARTGTIIFGGHSSTAVTTTARAKVTFIIPDARGRRRRTRQ